MNPVHIGMEPGHIRHAAAGAEMIYREKISGAGADRPQLAKLMASLKAGDVVLVTKLDRLGRSTRELLELIERIGKAGAAFRSLGDPLFDTTGAQGRLLATMLAAIAEFERELIPRAHRRWPGARYGGRRKVRPEAEAVRLPAVRSDEAPCCRCRRRAFRLLWLHQARYAAS